RRTDDLWSRRSATAESRGRIHRQDPAGRQSRGVARPAADDVQAGAQHEDRKCAPPCDPAVLAPTRTRGRRVIRRRISVAWFAGILFALSFATNVLAAEKTPTIGWLGLDSSMQADRLKSFHRGLRELGYVEGQNIHIEYRFAEGRFDQLPQLAAELLALHVDVSVTAIPAGVRAAQHATSTIPIVMLVHEPVMMGFAQTLARPGGNITGIAFQDTDLSTKRIDLFRQAVPGLSKVFILWNGVEGTLGPSLKAVEDAAKAVGMQVLSREW